MYVERQGLLPEEKTRRSFLRQAGQAGGPLFPWDILPWSQQRHPTSCAWAGVCTGSICWGAEMYSRICPFPG